MIKVENLVKNFGPKLAVNDVQRFEQTLLAEMKANNPQILAAIRDQREITKETEDKLKAALNSFAAKFA